MSDGSDGAGGVGGAGDNGADSAASAAESAVSDAVSALSDAVSSAVSSMAQSVGLSDALGQLGQALGIDAQDMQGIVGAAIMGAITGGLPGAVAAVAQGLIGGSLSDAAHDAVAASGMPAAMQAVANMAIDNFAQGVPGAFNAGSLQGTVSALANNVLGGQMPSAADIGEVARSVTGLTDVARGLLDGVAAGDFSSGTEAASAFDAAVRGAFEQGSQIASNVAADLAEGRGLYANGGHGPLGDAAEQVAVSAARLLSGQ